MLIKNVGADGNQQGELLPGGWIAALISLLYTTPEV